MIERFTARLIPVLRTIGLRFHWPLALALAWRLATVRIPVDGLRVGRSSPRLVLLPKLGGTEDIVAALEGRGRAGIELVGLPRREVKLVWRATMGGLADGLSDTDYRPDDPDLAIAKGHYRTLLIEVLGRYVRLVRAAGFVSANIAYYAERELAAACEHLGVPFLVLHKESIRTPAQRPWFTRSYRERIGPFTGRSVAVYNEDEATSLLDAGIVPEGRIEVTGAPRVDELHRVRSQSGRRAASEAATVLFAIDPAAGAWTPFDARGRTVAPRWHQLARQTEAAFVEAAAGDPAREYLIKVKLGREAATLGRLPDVLPRNLRVVTGGTATALFECVDVAIAFNSTVIAEAIAAGTPVLVPAFAEAAGSPEWTLPLEGAVTRIDRPDALAEAIRTARAAGRTIDLPDRQVEVLIGLVGDAHGRASDRVWAWIQRELGLRRG